MLTSRSFVMKTRSGGVIKIVREHYLREDVWCGSHACKSCQHFTDEYLKVTLAAEPESHSQLCTYPHYLVLDTNVILSQIDVIEDDAFQNVIILQTVLNEVKHRNIPAFKRIKDMIANKEKQFYVFVNEFHKDTYVERGKGESANDHNDRAIRTAARWYHTHLSECKHSPQPRIVLLTNDRENRERALAEGIVAYTVHEYVKSLKSNTELLDKLADIQTSDKMDVEEGKHKFSEHLSLSAIQQGIKCGVYTQGVFQTSQYNYLEATVVSHSEGAEQSEVFIQGSRAMNRAIHSDIVAVQLLPPEEWCCPSSVVIEDDAQDAGGAGDENEDKMLDRDRRVEEKRRAHLVPTGRVVGIIKRNWRPYCGILQSGLIKNSSRFLFKPAEKRIPKIRIETRQSDNLIGQRIICAIDSWPITSKYPHGHFVRKLGSVGERETENEVLLLEHDIPHQPFSQSVLNDLPPVPWSICEQDLSNRQDLRHLLIASIDPPGCTDIDDALHCRILDNGNYEVGVHIADVTHFIKPNTAMDREAASRGTTVYLADKRIDMIPELLSSNLCSLRPHGDRLAFSCLWELSDRAEILSTTFTKSIITSREAFTYAEAQLRIDDPTQQDPLTLSLRMLNELAKLLHQRRIERGALILASPEIRFHIDSESHDPIDVQAKQLQDTNCLVEEFMLLANISTARKILEEFPECALLRRHPSPPPSNYDPLVKAAAAKGLKIETDTAKQLQQSLDLAVDSSNAYFNTMMRIVATRCMMQALYFSSGATSKSEYHHYGLATPIYTHFTSPIRRYSDVIVHRLLAVCIGAEKSYADLLNKHKMQNLCKNLNYRHKMSQYAQRASISLHTQLFFKTRVEDVEGYVLFVKKNALQVLVPKYGLEGMLFLRANKRAVSLFTFSDEDCTQTAGGVTVRMFDKLTVQLSIDRTDEQHVKLQLHLVHPVVEGFSVPPAPSTHRTDSEPPTKKPKK